MFIPPFSGGGLSQPVVVQRAEGVVDSKGVQWSVTIDRYQRRPATLVVARAFRTHEAARRDVEQNISMIDALSSVVVVQDWWQTDRLPSWMGMAQHDATRYPNRHVQDRFDYEVSSGAFGYPMLALRWEMVYYSEPPEIEPDALLALRQQHRGLLKLSKNLWLPTLPIWPGLLFNTLFYAAIWFAFFTGLAALRTARRLRRGLCPVCRYDLRGLPQRACPECGWGRKPAAPRGTDT